MRIATEKQKFISFLLTLVLTIGDDAYYTVVEPAQVVSTLAAGDNSMLNLYMMHLMQDLVFISVG